MIDFLTAIGIDVHRRKVALESCCPQPGGPAGLASPVLLSASQFGLPVVCPEEQSYRVVSGRPVFVVAQSSNLRSIDCAVLPLDLSSGIKAFLQAAGEMYDGQELHPLLRAQVLWLVFFWTNAQALYKRQKERPADEGTSIPPSPMVFAKVARDIDELCEELDLYMQRHFEPPRQYTSAATGKVLVSWGNALARFPQVVSKTRRKVLIRELFYQVPPALRRAFRQVQGPEILLRALAQLPPKRLEQTLADLKDMPPKQQKAMLVQIRASGGARQSSGRGHVVPGDALVTDRPGAFLDSMVFHNIITGLNRVNQALRGLPPDGQITRSQNARLFRITGQLWELIAPLLDQTPVEDHEELGSD